MPAKFVAIKDIILKLDDKKISIKNKQHNTYTTLNCENLRTYFFLTNPNSTILHELINKTKSGFSDKNDLLDYQHIAIHLIELSEEKLLLELGNQGQTIFQTAIATRQFELVIALLNKFKDYPQDLFKDNPLQTFDVIFSEIKKSLINTQHTLQQSIKNEQNKPDRELTTDIKKVRKLEQDIAKIQQEIDNTNDYQSRITKYLLPLQHAALQRSQAHQDLEQLLMKLEAKVAHLHANKHLIAATAITNLISSLRAHNDRFEAHCYHQDGKRNAVEFKCVVQEIFQALQGNIVAMQQIKTHRGINGVYARVNNFFAKTSAQHLFTNPPTATQQLIRQLSMLYGLNEDMEDYYDVPHTPSQLFHN